MQGLNFYLVFFDVYSYINNGDKMKLIVGTMDKKLQTFIKKSTFSERMMLINKMCNVKTINEDVDVIIPYGIITSVGLISNTYVHLEELLITLNVRKLIYTNKYNKQIFESLQKKYHFELLYLDLTQQQNFTF